MWGCSPLCLSFSIESWSVTIAAINSRTLMDARPRSRIGISNVQARPCMDSPPKPHVQASE